MPLVSVIIPVYNVEKYLKQCLDSVLNQTLKDIEIICIDDGSIDNSLSILKKYQEKDNRIKILQQQNQYAGVARNNGLKIATGKYLSFLDSDDFFELNMLEEMYNKAEQDQSDIVICGWTNYNPIKKNIHLPNTDKKLFDPIEIKETLFNITYPNPWTKLFKRELFINNNLQFENLKRCNDFTCVYTALALASKISIIKKSFIHYRSGQTNNLTANRGKNIGCFIQAVNKLYENLIHFNKYKTYKLTFISRVLNSLKKEISFCDNTNAFYNLIKNVLNKDLYNDLSIELNKIFNNSIKKIPNKIYHKKNKYF